MSPATVSVDVLYKAERLIETGAVHQIDRNRFVVDGDHGAYLVALLAPDEVPGTREDVPAFVCSCPWSAKALERRRRPCSHATAAFLIEAHRFSSDGRLR